MNNSKIEWTDATWNPIVGCSKVSEGCRNCYAMTMSARIANAAQAALRQGKVLTDVQAAYRNVVKWEKGKDRAADEHDKALPQWNNLIAVIDSVLTLPLRWKSPRRIFVDSMGDLFHESVPFEVIDQVFAVMALCSQHTFQVLTKRPERMAEYLNGKTPRQYGGFSTGVGNEFHHTRCQEIGMHLRGAGSDLLWDTKTERDHQWEIGRDLQFNSGHHVGWPLPNVWLGTSVENQEQADKRIPELLQCPAAVRFLSCEPLLGPVELLEYFGSEIEIIGPTGKVHYRRPPGYRGDDVLNQVRNTPGYSLNPLGNSPIRWVICGGESGHGARPMHPDWARSLRDQCQAAGVPFLFKQWGEFQDGSCGNAPTFAVLSNGEYCLFTKEECESLSMKLGGRWNEFNPCSMAKVGKKAAGRLLDGLEWNEFPEVLG